MKVLSQALSIVAAAVLLQGCGGFGFVPLAMEVGPLSASGKARAWYAGEEPQPHMLQGQSPCVNVEEAPGFPGGNFKNTENTTALLRRALLQQGIATTPSCQQATATVSLREATGEDARVYPGGGAAFVKMDVLIAGQTFTLKAGVTFSKEPGDPFDNSLHAAAAKIDELYMPASPQAEQNGGR